jgi:hypothetical protein
MNKALDLAGSAHRVFCLLNDSFVTWDDLSHENRQGWLRVAKHSLEQSESASDCRPLKDIAVELYDIYADAVGAEPPGAHGRMVWEGIARHLWALSDECDEDVPLGVLEQSWLEWASRQRAQRPHNLQALTRG